eukprot:gene3023-3843_t
MELSSRVGAWLVKLGIVDPSAVSISSRDGKVVLDDTTSIEFESGLGFATLVSVLAAQAGLEPAPMDTFKETPTAVTKLYNWNLLEPVLKAFSVELDPDMKALIVAGGKKDRFL